MEEVKELEKLYSRRGYLLDVGTGWSKNLNKMLKWSKGTVISVDSSDEPLAKALQKFPGDIKLELLRCVAQRLPFRGSSFALVSSTFVLHHIEDKRAVAKEFERVMKEGGLGLILDWLPTSPASSIHSPEVLKENMFETLSAFKKRFAYFTSKVMKETYLIYVEKR